MNEETEKLAEKIERAMVEYGKTWDRHSTFPILQACRDAGLVFLVEGRQHFFDIRSIEL